MSNDPDHPIDHEAIASYFPRAFCIQILSLEFEKPLPGASPPAFPSEELPTIMHEVAHLVQDRATFRGVLDFMDMWDRVGAISQCVRESGDEVVFPLVDLDRGQYRVPEHLHWSVETELLLNFREPRIRWKSKEQFWAYQSHEVILVQAKLAGRQFEYPRVTVKFVDNATGDMYQHVLGARELKEAYSVAVALMHGGKVKEFGIANYKYLVVDRILSYFFGEVSPRQMVAICHWALQDLSPANTLFSLIDHFAEDGGILPDEDTIYDWARSDAINRGFRENVRDLMENVKQYQEHYGKQHDLLEVLFRWFHNHAVTLFKSHMDERRRFPLDTFLCTDSQGLDEATRNAGQQSLFAEVEVPLIIYPDGDFYSISGDREEASTIVFFLSGSDRLTE